VHQAVESWSPTVLAVAGPAGRWWAYLALFVFVAASWAGVPMVGSLAVGSAAVAASQGKLDLAAVIVVASVAGEVGGVLGYQIGDRWGRRLLGRPGKRQAGRQRLIEQGERAYAKWGRLAVFFTPAIISGTAKMNYRQFAIWNLIASTAFALAVAPTGYGVGRVATGHHSAEDLTIFALGLVAGSVLMILVVRRHRHHKAEIAAGGRPAG